MKTRILGSLVPLVLSGLPGSATAQNLFLSGGSSGDIYRYTMSGTRATLASGLFYQGLACDNAGNLFAASPASGANAIFEFTPAGTRSTFASGLDQPYGLAFGSGGNLFEADFGSGTIYEFTPRGARSSFALGLGHPYGLAFDPAGDLFVTAYRNSSLYRLTPDGLSSTFGSGLVNPIGIACDAAGNVFVADQGGGGGADGSIYKFAPDGTRTTFATGLDVIGLAFDDAGSLYAAEYDGAASNIIYKFTPDGARSTFASGVNGNGMFFLAYQVPEPSVPGMLGMAGLVLVGFGRRLCGGPMSSSPPGPSLTG